jgi:hypothetical protein
MKFYVGIDPDTKATGIVVLVEGRLRYVACVRADDLQGMASMVSWTIKKIGSFVHALGSAHSASVTIEDQEIAYSSKSGANPRSMIPLAQVAGMAFGIAASQRKLGDVQEFVKPVVWKGSVKKHVKQGWVFDRLGISYRVTTGKEPYCVPTVTIPGADFPEGCWKHVADAVGIALWAYDRDVLKERMEKARQR